jgi:uncharacterized oligopeptide transporter (OPT) family protein
MNILSWIVMMVLICMIAAELLVLSSSIVTDLHHYVGLPPGVTIIAAIVAIWFGCESFYHYATRPEDKGKQ